MLIPINIDLPGPSTPRRPQLPPQLVQFGTDELLLIELQGALEVEGNADGQLVGKLEVDSATVSRPLHLYMLRRVPRGAHVVCPVYALEKVDSDDRPS